MNDETKPTPSVNEHGEPEVTQKPGERPHLLTDQGFSLLRYSNTDPENFNELALFDEHIAPLVEVMAALCEQVGIPCYMAFTPCHTSNEVLIRDVLVSTGPERLTPQVLMAAAAVRCNADEAALVGEAIDMRTSRYMESLDQKDEATPNVH